METEKTEAAIAGIEKMMGGGEVKADDQQQEQGEAQAGAPRAEGEQTTAGQEPATGDAGQPQEQEVEIDGEKYMMPAKIASKFIQHGDYTRKTQDIAEMRRVLSAQTEGLQINAAFEQSIAGERRDMTLLDAQIGALQGSNWQAMGTEDLLKTRALLDQLKDARANLDGQVKAKRAPFDEKLKALRAEALTAGRKLIEQRIKGFDEKAEVALKTYGEREGYTHAELASLMDPRIAVTLWKAMQWDDLQAASPGILKRASQAAPVVRPGATQRPASRVTQLNQNFAKAKGQEAKKDAALDYFAERLR
jgi:hypothetical protein